MTAILTKFWISGSLIPTPFANHWHAQENPWYTVPCQISTWLVYHVVLQRRKIDFNIVCATRFTDLYIGSIMLSHHFYPEEELLNRPYSNNNFAYYAVARVQWQCVNYKRRFINNYIKTNTQIYTTRRVAVCLETIQYRLEERNSTVVLDRWRNCLLTYWRTNLFSSCIRRYLLSSFTCLRLKDASIMCRVTYFQFPIHSAFSIYRLPGRTSTAAYYWF